MDATQPNLTFFNRIVLWYDPKGGMQNSVLQFITEIASPQVLASVDSTTATEISYDWWINDDEHASHKDNVIASYEVELFKIVDGDLVSYRTSTQGENTTVGEHKRAEGGAFPNKDENLTAGTYVYEVTVTYEDGTVRTARSNEVTLYSDDNLIYPEPRAVQLLELNNEGLRMVDNKSQAKNEKSKTYMTTRTSDGRYYLVNPIHPEGNTEVIESLEVNEVKPEDAERLLSSPSLYTWTSQYFLRSLYADRVKSTLQQYVSAGLMPRNTDVDAVMQSIKLEGKVTDLQEQPVNDSKLSAFKSTTVKMLDNSTAEVYAALLSRQGSLESTAVTVDLTMPWGGNEKTTSARYEVTPVMPKPERLSATYHDGEEYLKADPQNPDWVTGNVVLSTTSAVLTDEDGQPKKVDVVFRNEDFQMRNLTVAFGFRQPNVALEVLSRYEIRYDLRITNTKTLAGTAQVGDAEYLDLTATYVDINTEADTRYYSLEVSNVDPSLDNHPVLIVEKVTYVERNGDTPNPANSLEGTYTYYDLKHEAVLEITLQEKTIAKMKLNKAIMYDGSVDYIYEEYTNFDDPGEIVRGTPNTVSENLLPLFYHVETVQYEDNDDTTIKKVEGRTSLSRDLSYYGLGSFYADATSGSQIAKPQMTEELYFSFPYVTKQTRNGQNTAEHNGLKYKEGDTERGRLLAPCFPNQDNPNLKIYFTPVYVFHRDVKHSAYLDGIKGLQLLNEGPSHARSTFVDNKHQLVVMRGMSAVVSASDITFNTTVGIDTIEAGEGTTMYYDLQGMRVSQPLPGRVYIAVRGTQATKVVYTE